MGFNVPIAQFLRHLLRTGVRFRETLTIGHQQIYMSPGDYARELAALGASPTAANKYADDFFRALGAESLEVADISTYEGATLCHDLNLPLPATQRRQFDCVFDGGSLEHVFNFPQALKTCMELTRVGGHLVIVTSGNNLFGHGFYQFSPELFFRALAPANGFEVEALLLCDAGRWFATADPATVGSRVELLTRAPMLLFVAARRIANLEPFEKWPQQSDYLTAWDSTVANAEMPAAPSLCKDFALRFRLMRRLQEHWQEWKGNRRRTLSNRAFFSPVTLQT
jgi:SAM-dependent methyltransferase